MPKLADTQSVLLASAAQRDSGSLYPLPENLTPGARVAHAVRKLIALTLVVERDFTSVVATHRVDRALRFGPFITPAGLQATDVELGGGEQLNSSSEALSPSPSTAASREIKASQVLALLSRPDGATLVKLIAAIGWLPHATPAALTGLRKKGHTVDRSKRGGQNSYCTVKADAA